MSVTLRPEWESGMYGVGTSALAGSAVLGASVVGGPSILAATGISAGPLLGGGTAVIVLGVMLLGLLARRRTDR